jgi:hypothetical protein
VGFRSRRATGATLRSSESASRISSRSRSSQPILHLHLATRVALGLVNLIAIQSQSLRPNCCDHLHLAGLRSSASAQSTAIIHSINIILYQASATRDNYPMRTMETSVDEICSGDFAERVRINQSRLMAGQTLSKRNESSCSTRSKVNGVYSTAVFVRYLLDLYILAIRASGL